MNKVKKEKFDLSTIFTSVLNDIIELDPQKTFYYPVDTKMFFDYTKKISKPMDLQTMQKKIKKYTGWKEFESDLNLIWNNCRVYNQENSDIYKASFRLERFSKKCLKDHLIPYKQSYKFDDKGAPIKKRKYNRVKDNAPNMQESASIQCSQFSSSEGDQKQQTEERFQGISGRNQSLIGKSIVKKGRGDKRIEKRILLNGRNSSHNHIILGLQQHFVEKDNIIQEEDRIFLREKVSKFSQEELFKCIKTIQEFEPQNISQLAKEQYSVDLSSISKTTFSKIKEQFSF